MARLTRALPALQARSRRTLDRLLDAAEAVLAEHGLEAATVPAIARKAGLSVGVVYRRFPDKDALLRGVYERFFDRANELRRAGLARAHAADLDTPRLVRAIVKGMVYSYRMNRGVVRGLILYWLTHPDPRFRRIARAHNQRTMEAIDELFRPRYAEIHHPDANRALHLALVTVAGILQILILDESDDRFPFADDPARLAEEFSRLTLRYLGLKEESDRAAVASRNAARGAKAKRGRATSSSATPASARSPRRRRPPSSPDRRA